MTRRNLCLFAISLPLWGCGSALGDAVDSFENGRLPEAAQRFRALEAEAFELEPHERLRFALYHGLTEFALGDPIRAERWLAPLRLEVARDPRLLSDAERGALFAAVQSSGRLPGE